ncbi:MAG: hypothetical protein VKK04_04500 [Synechococcales bacterium]|nr:hypothetical protein [Synechococcales bacterium]
MALARYTSSLNDLALASFLQGDRLSRRRYWVAEAIAQTSE